jgi:dolichol-phosphate mannosyltransferase
MSVASTNTTANAMVVIPTYNERDNIESVVEAILALPPHFHVLVVDDGSPDGTGAIADDLARRHDRVQVLHRTAKEGIGPAYVAGFRHALAWGASHVLQMDADHSHDPADLPRLLAATEDADLVIGSRYKGGVRVLNWSVKRLILSLGASKYVKAVLGIPVEDPTGGFKCWRRRVLQSLDLDRIASKGYSFQIEMNYRAWKRGFRVVEVPIVFSERVRGGSKISNHIVYEAVYVLWRLRFHTAHDRKLSVPPEPVEGRESEGAVARR